MAVMKTPGVYIVEKSAFPNSVVEVPTAIPAFVGYTDKAINGTDSLINKPWKISSMAEYQNYFGGAPLPTFEISGVAVKADGSVPIDGEASAEGSKTSSTSQCILKLKTPNDGSYEIVVKNNYTLYYNMLLFFANGGGPCYIVAVGSYNDEVTAKSMINGITPLLKESEPTMLVIPEAVNLPSVDDCIKVQQAMLKHSGLEMKSRFSILDIYMDKYKDDSLSCIGNFREKIGSNQLNFGAAYYPWLASSVLSDSDITLDNIDLPTLIVVVKSWTDADKKALVDYIVAESVIISNGKYYETIQNKKNIHQALLQNWNSYSLIVKAIRENLNLLPPSAAMAGLYTMVDNTRGVWKAPANISVNNVVKPSLNITNAEQEDLNVPMNGKSINAIRSFIGEGIKVWGARTLDGNSLDWRYINVRRTMIYLEESVKNAARAYVFEPNDANTWLSMRCMIESFLRSVWKRGGLAGTTPEDAYAVHIGLGDTMTPEDILEGIMRITVLVSVSRPAEFIEITFQQQAQKS